MRQATTRAENRIFAPAIYRRLQQPNGAQYPVTVSSNLRFRKVGCPVIARPRLRRHGAPGRAALWLSRRRPRTRSLQLSRRPASSCASCRCRPRMCGSCWGVVQAGEASEGSSRRIVLEEHRSRGADRERMMALDWNALVGAARFELATPSPPDWCANRAALRSELRRTIVSGVRRGNRTMDSRATRAARVIVDRRTGLAALAHPRR